MNYSEFLNQLHQTPAKYDITKEDNKLINQDKAKWITAKLMRTDFRRGKFSQETHDFVLSKVKESIKLNHPLYLVGCFGGYKHFWNPSHPTVDWAEYFHLAFIREYLSPILEIWEPGVVFEWESEDVIIPIMNNYPESTVEEYAKSFNALLNHYSATNPSNLKFNLMRATEQYSKDDLIKKMDELKPAQGKIWASLNPEELETRLHRTPENIMWQGAQDLTNFSQKEKEDYILQAKIKNDTFYDADFALRGDYFDHPEHIPLVFTFGLGYENVGNWLILGSTRSSFVDFWVGRGLLEERDDRLIPRIVSHQQYDQIKNELNSVAVNIFEGNNFLQIEVFKGIIS